MADLIKDEIGANAELIEGSGGVFDVRVDGKLIYSKHETGRFPEPYDDVINRLQPMA